MKRTRLERRTPLARKPMRRRTGDARNSYARRERDFEYMAFVKTMPCALSGESGHRCDGASEADHAGDVGVRGLGAKADDRTCIALCPGGHRERTERRGYFAGMDTLAMRAWTEAQIARHQAAYAEHRALHAEAGVF